MSRIVLTDDPATSVSSTFLDDSYQRDDPYAPVVVARIPADADLRWHEDVVTRLAPRYRELKGARVLKHLSELPADLQRAVKKTIREACISILDPRVYTFQFEQMLSRVGGRYESIAKVQIRQKFLSAFVRDEVLWDSPAWRIQRMLFPEPLFDLSEVYGVSSAYQIDDSLLDSLKKKLRKPHAVRVFGARSAAALRSCSTQRSRYGSLTKSKLTSATFSVRTSTRLCSCDAALRVRCSTKGERTSVDAIELLRKSADEAVSKLVRNVPGVNSIAMSPR